MRETEDRPFLCLRTGVRRLFGLLAIAAGVWADPVAAHIQEQGTSLRVVHVVAEPDGYRVFYRLNFGLVVGNGLGRQLWSGRYEPAPFTWNEIDGALLQHFVEPEQIRQAPEMLGELVLAGHDLRADDEILSGTVRRLRVHAEGNDPPFRTLAEIRTAMDGPLLSGFDIEDVSVRRAFLDAEVFYPSASGTQALALSSSLKPGRVAAPQIANVIVYQIGSWSVLRRVEGQLEAPVALHRSRMVAVFSSLRVGAEHILGGFDHLLFVICVLIGAASLAGLLWRITGFTVGHSVTLAMGYFGLAPSGPWFVPLVEVGIALSIAGSALAALRRWEAVGPAFVATGMVGLVHGFGFSFALRDILPVDDPDLLLSLVAFNSGVEVGQLAIVLGLWPCLRLFDRFGRGAQLRCGLALFAAAISAYWIALRAPDLVSALVI